MDLILRTTNLLDKQGNRILIGWMGMPDIQQMTKDGHIA